MSLLLEFVGDLVTHLISDVAMKRLWCWADRKQRERIKRFGKGLA